MWLFGREKKQREESSALPFVRPDYLANSIKMNSITYASALTYASPLGAGTRAKRSGAVASPWACLNHHISSTRFEVPKIDAFRRDVKVRVDRIARTLGPMTRTDSNGQLSAILVNDVPPTARRRSVRSCIREFSDASRRRLVHTIRNMDDMPVFLTLTYPNDFPMDGKIVKKHLNLFLTWLRKRGVSGIWFMEFQRRGAPHFHMLLSEAIDFPIIARRWYEIVGSGDMKHFAAGTRIEYMREVAAGVRYAEKYAIKSEQKLVPEGFESVGRFWGRFGFKLERLLVNDVVPDTVAVALGRVLRRFVVASRRRFTSGSSFSLSGRTVFTVYGGTSVVNRYLEWLNVDFPPVGGARGGAVPLLA